jgi:hypothetical protein
MKPGEVCKIWTVAKGQTQFTDLLKHDQITPFLNHAFPMFMTTIYAKIIIPFKATRKLYASFPGIRIQ